MLLRAGSLTGSFTSGITAFTIACGWRRTSSSVRVAHNNRVSYFQLTLSWMKR